MRMRGEDAELVRGESELNGLWKGYFEQLMYKKGEEEAVVTSMGTDAGRGRVPMQRDIGKLEVERAIVRLECGKRRVWME